MKKLKPPPSYGITSSCSLLTNGPKMERSINIGRLGPLLLSSLAIITTFSLFLLYSPNPLKPFIQKQVPSDQNHILVNPQKEECDIFKGHWIHDIKGSSPYTNSSCSTIPDSKNCFKHGRKDTDFLNWRWKPDQCDLPRFNPKTFFEIVRGKTMAFVGDSVSRNHFESLLCFLSQVEVPTDVYKDSEERDQIWQFPEHDFTVKIIWTKFLVVGEERVINGSNSGVYDLYMDKMDTNWTRQIENADYIIISDAHWFFRPLYLRKGSDVIGCVYCNERNVTSRSVGFSISMALRAAFSHINQCKKCKNSVTTILRTFSPAHFENGVWNTGGTCNRTHPATGKDSNINLDGSEWEIRTMQLEEIKTARKKKKQGKKLGVVDITRAMLMRPDGHPGEFWGNMWMKGYNDCVHWCLPGPIDSWNDFLLAVLMGLGEVH